MALFCAAIQRNSVSLLNLAISWFFREQYNQFVAWRFHAVVYITIPVWSLNMYLQKDFTRRIFNIYVKTGFGIK